MDRVLDCAHRQIVAVVDQSLDGLLVEGREAVFIRLTEALAKWAVLRDPEPGDFLFPSPADPSRAWTNPSLNRRLHRIADRLRESGRLPGFETGRDSDRRLTMHSWRHTCASEMLERGVPVPLAAEWIGDKLETFKEVYGNPTLEDVCRATLAGYGSEEGA